MKIKWLIGLLILGISSCQIFNINPEKDKSNGISIVSGQSFGMCIGKCTVIMQLTDTKVSLEAQERIFENNAPLIKKYNYADKISDSKYKEIYDALNLEKIKKLDNKYGCPDCADGGTEWIEILENGESIKKIEFEYGKNIPEIEGLLELLREQRLALINKHL